MVILGQRWAESYMAGHPGKIIQVTRGGSGTGIAALINGITDICQSSRRIKEDENKQMVAKFGAAAHEIVVSKDGLAIYVHDSNPVQELDLAQLKAIYTSAVTNWKAVGGPDAPITVYGRKKSSGTYEHFKEQVLGGADYAAAVQTLLGTAAVVNAVAQDPRGIGYGGVTYAKGVRYCAVKKDAATAGVQPTEENVNAGRYPISRSLYFYLRTAPAGPIKEFVDFALSDEGQKLVTEVGYLPAQ